MQCEGNGFIRFDLNINSGINRDDGDGGIGRKAHRFGDWSGRNAAVISAKGGGAAHGIVHRQSSGGETSAGEGVDEIGDAILFYHSRRDSQTDHRRQVVIKDRANHRSGVANVVTAASGEGESNGFIRLDRAISGWINGDGGCGRTRGEGDRFTGSWCGACVVRAIGSTGDAVING